jgi:hypothetical protein
MATTVAALSASMTTSAFKTYNRADYDRIKREGFTFVLPAETIQTIKKIASNVGAPEYIKTPHFEKKHIHRTRVQPKEITDTEWDTLRNFKTTAIEKKKGIDLSIDTIRKHLNKMTDKTYDALKVHIITEIDNIVGVGEGVDSLSAELLVDLNKIGDSIFDIASGNSFYSHMYATLYKELMAKYEFMKTIFTNKIETDVSIFTDFNYCDPNKDYDTFCKNNKTNEKRRALGLFYVNLMLQDIIPSEKIVSMIEELQVDILSCIKKENNTNIVEEMSELIYIFVIKGASKLKLQTESWTEIVERINLVSVKKPKSEPSISNKTIFKHMDMQSAIVKMK